MLPMYKHTPLEKSFGVTMFNAFLNLVFANPWLFPLLLLALCVGVAVWIGRQLDTRTYNAYGPVPQGNEVWAANVQKKLADRAKAQANEEAKAKAKSKKPSLERQWDEEERRKA
jgi:hypothetical protein